jgi:hypothetical protein
MAAKWPPRSKGVHRTTLFPRSASALQRLLAIRSLERPIIHTDAARVIQEVADENPIALTDSTRKPLLDALVERQATVAHEL